MTDRWMRAMVSPTWTLLGTMALFIGCKKPSDDSQRPLIDPLALRRGSGGSGPAGDPAACAASPVQPMIVTCPIVSCGNSAKVYGSYIEALDVRGKEMQELFPEPKRGTAFRLERETLTGAGGGCRDLAKLSLEVRNGGFVGVLGPYGRGEVKCTGTDLDGASVQLAGFGLEIDDQILKTIARGTTTLRIRLGGGVSTLDVSSQTLPTYDLEYQRRPFPFGPPLWLHLCPASQWPSSPRQTFAAEPTQQTTESVLVEGEVYATDASIKQRGAYWFNIACAGSGLADLRIHGLNPMMNRASSEPDAPMTSTADERQATLKLITAKYCGERSWTRDGTQIYWRDYESKSAPQSNSEASPIESRWGPQGALCLSHLRLWSVGSPCANLSEQLVVEGIRRDCKIPACDESHSCGTAGEPHDDATLAWTCTVNHIRHSAPGPKP